jgi:hypothetical protein
VVAQSIAGITRPIFVPEHAHRILEITAVLEPVSDCLLTAGAVNYQLVTPFLSTAVSRFFAYALLWSGNVVD